MGKPLLSREEYKKLWEHYGSVRAISKAIGAGRTKVGNDLRKYGINTEPVEPRVEILSPSDDEVLFHAENVEEPTTKPSCGYDKKLIEVIGHRVYDEKTIEDLWDAVEKYQMAHNGQKKVCRKVTVKYDDDYLLIVFLADIHVGSESSELRLIKHHMKEIASRSNIILVLCGDYTDNFITFAQNEQLIQPGDQQRLLDYIINTIRNKIVGVVRGNHDERDKKISDKDMVEMTCEKVNAPYLGAEGWISVFVRDKEYLIYAAHKFRFNSADNQTHTVKKAFEKRGAFDIGVISHNHTGAVEQAPKWGIHRIYIRPGTYKIYDRYALNEGYGESEVCVPCVLLFGKKRQMIPFYNLEDALLVLDLLQKDRK